MERFGLDGIRVEALPEAAAGGDHFDPQARAVRLSARNYHGRSLTAVAVAAHEVGHAIQCHRNEPIFRLRARYMPLAVGLARVGVWTFAAAPVAALLIRSPVAIVALAGVGLALQLAAALVHLIVLPEEWDASFNKALPILADGNYVHRDDLPAVRQVLRAAALTYFAAALANMLNLSRWLLLLTRR